MKRFLSFALCLLLVLTQFLTLPIGTSAAAAHYTVWVDADGLDQAGAWTLEEAHGTMSKGAGHAYSGDAYVWNRGTDGAASTARMALPRAPQAADTALVFWVDTTAQIAATAGYAVKLYTMNAAGKETCFKIAASGTASLVSGTTVTALTCGDDSVTLPNGTAGWVVIPYTSFVNQWGPESAIASGSAYSLFLQTGTNYNSMLYLDDIGFAEDGEAFISAVRAGTLVADRPQPCAVYGHAWAAASCTAAACCEVCGVTGEAALGHTYDSNGVCERCGSSITASNEWFRTVADFTKKKPSFSVQANATIAYTEKSGSGYGAGLLWTKKDPTANSDILMINEYGQAGDEGIAFWVSMKESGVGAFTRVRLMIHDSVSGSERCWKLKFASTYYFVENGVASTQTTSTSQTLDIPGTLEGWVVIPYSSFEHHWGGPAGQVQTLNPATVRKLDLFSGDKAITGPVQLDEYGYVSDIAAFLESLGGFPCTQVVLNDMEGDVQQVADTDAPDTTLTITDGVSQSGAALYIQTAGGDVHLAVRKKKEAMATFAGLGFWIAAGETGFNLRLSLGLEDGSAVPVSSTGYYRLVNERDGTTGAYRFRENTLFIPGGFTGWVAVDTSVFASSCDLLLLQQVTLSFDGPATAYVDTLQVATSDEGLITREWGYPLDQDLIYSLDPAKAAVSVLADGQRLISLYAPMDSAAFWRAVELRPGYRAVFDDAAGVQVFGAVADMEDITEIKVYLSSTYLTSYLLTSAGAEGSPCAMLGHNWAYGSCTVAGSCAVCGEPQPEDTVGHRWQSATCTTDQRCVVCATVGQPATGHTWLAATCGDPETCETCGLTRGEIADVPHTWYRGACAVCSKNLFTVAQGFEEDAAVSYGNTAAYSLVTGQTDFGGQALQLTTVARNTQVNIEFDVDGHSSDVALAFWYDLTDNTVGSAECLFYVYPRDSVGNLITLSGKNIYYTIVDGEVTARTSNNNMGVRVPNRTAGWVVLPIPGNSSWQNTSVSSPYYGTMQSLSGINIVLPNTIGCQMRIDHFLYAKDIDHINGMAAAGNLNVTGCTKGVVCEDTAHVWQAATCGEAGYCTVCGLANALPMGGHTFVEATCTTPEYCSACSRMTNVATGHTWTAATCTVPKTCSVCGETEGEPAGHTYQTDVTPPTCTEQGYTVYTCQVCGDTYTGDYVTATGHTWTAATCTVPKTCSVCGETEGAAAGHAYQAEVTPPTCTEQGYTVYTCQVCGDTYTGDYVTATDHTWTAATCTTPKTCEACGETEGELGEHRYTGSSFCLTCGGAFDRWVCTGGGWYYYAGSGEPVTNWQSIGGRWYYFDTSGVMQTGWLKSGGIYYYLEPSGAMATGWLKLGTTWYYLEPSGVMTTGWKQINGTWYYFQPSGAMATGWLKLGNAWYYLESSGRMVTGWRQVGGTWYYFQPSGVMATGWLKLGSTWYYLEPSGAMVTRWKQINGTWYYFYSDGRMAANCTIDGCWLNAGGAWVR